MQQGRCLRNTFGLILSLASLGLHAENGLSDPKSVFIDLLKEYKRFKECHDVMAEEIKTISKVDPEAVHNLPENLLKPRYDQYNVNYLNYMSLEKKVSAQEKELEKRLEKTPLSDLANRGDLEVKVVAIRTKYKYVTKTVCMLSVQANRDIMGAMQTLPTEKRTVKAPSAPAPTLPGLPGPSREERLRTSESEKINLMPVDDEFYATQLGQKLEKDLGGKAEFWSYDYDANDLYVKVGNDVGKLSVREESPGIRFIRTRVGGGYVDPRGKDTLVDNMTAQGKFLTRNPREENLFGRFPAKQAEVFSNEKKPGSSAPDGHNHNH